MRHEGLVIHAAFSPDSRRVVTASRNLAEKHGEARVWDAATGRPVTPPMKHAHRVNHAAFSPDGRRVLTVTGAFGTGGPEARVWDAATGQPVGPPMRHGDSVFHAAFSPDGRYVVTAGGDNLKRRGEARLWDAATGEPVAPRPGQAKDLIALAHLLSGMQLNRAGELVPLTPAEFRALWQDLRPRYPEVFVCTSEEILGWHWREAAACEDAGTWSWAVIHLNALIEAEPNSWMLLARRGRAHAALGRWHDAIVDASKAIALRPEQDQLWKPERIWLLRGNAHAELGEWKEAAADLTRASDDASGEAAPQLDLALVHLAADDLDKYRGACARLVRDFGKKNDPQIESVLAWACILKANSVEDWEAVVRWARAAKAASTDPDKHQALQTLGAATYRAGQYDEAIGHLSAAMKAFSEPATPQPGADPKAGGTASAPITGGDALDWLFLAMAHHRLGHRGEARKWLDKAVASIDRTTQGAPDGDSSGSRIDWKTRLAHRVLRREAEALILGAAPDHPTTSSAKGSAR
jgi:tetratricopeptide (TPR) repeat protein